MNLKEAKDRYGQIAAQVEQMKILVESEKRTATPEEKEASVKLLNEMDALEVEIDRLDFEERMDATLQKAKESREKRIVRPSPVNVTGEKKGFRSFGEFLQAVYVAGTSPKVDSRLTYTAPPEYRAATGMSETIAADGGFLVQQDFAQELFRLIHETGKVASRVRRMPISASSNSIKINAVAETSRATGSRWGGVRGYW